MFSLALLAEDELGLLSCLVEIPLFLDGLKHFRTDGKYKDTLVMLGVNHCQFAVLINEHFMGLINAQRMPWLSWYADAITTIRERGCNVCSKRMQSTRCCGIIFRYVGRSKALNKGAISFSAPSRRCQLSEWIA